MHINAGILLSGMLVMASAAAAPMTTSTEIGNFQPVTVGSRMVNSESSRQGAQHSRLIKHLQPVTYGQTSNDNGKTEKVENHH
jgi:hypothetical protein